MKKLILALSALFALTTAAQAEMVVCGQPVNGPVPANSEVHLFMLTAKRDTLPHKYWVVQLTHHYGANGKIVSSTQGEPMLLKAQSKGEGAYRKWTFAAGGMLEFTSDRFEKFKYRGRAMFVAPNGPEVAQIFENCLFDDIEVGFTVGN
jgi:hypothetical protein